jgi:hypothetical protein
MINSLNDVIITKTVNNNINSLFINPITSSLYSIIIDNEKRKYLQMIIRGIFLITM